MSPKAARWWVIILGALLCVGSLVYLALCMMLYSMRYTYARAVFYARDTGVDPYEAARTGLHELALGFRSAAILFAVTVFIIGFILATGAIRRP